MSTSDPDGWSKAVPIGIFAGIPTAVFLQVGFVRTLVERGEAVRPSRLGGLYPPGLGFAIVRDCVYWAATQKQVQTPKPTFTENLTCQFCVVGVPLVCDTLSVRVVDPAFKWPRTWSATLALACPPVALLGRATWIPVYNWAYVVTQQRIGDDTWHKEAAGLVAGSLAASVVAYPLFVFKTNMLLSSDAVSLRALPRILADALARTCGAPKFSTIETHRPATVLAAVYKGLRPHTIANIGPDVLCMAIGRLAYKFIFSPT